MPSWKPSCAASARALRSDTVPTCGVGAATRGEQRACARARSHASTRRDVSLGLSGRREKHARSERRRDARHRRADDGTRRSIDAPEARARRGLIGRVDAQLHRAASTDMPAGDACPIARRRPAGRRRATGPARLGDISGTRLDLGICDSRGPRRRGVRRPRFRPHGVRPGPRAPVRGLCSVGGAACRRLDGRPRVARRRDDEAQTPATGGARRRGERAPPERSAHSSWAGVGGTPMPQTGTAVANTAIRTAGRL